MIDIDVCIIGGGPAGIYAGYCCGTSGLTSCIIDALDELGGQCIALYNRKEIYGVPGFCSVSAGDFIASLKKQSLPFITAVLSNRIANNISIDNDRFIINTQAATIGRDDDCDDIVRAKYVVLATGIGNMKPNVPKTIANLDNFISTGDVHFYNCKFEQYCGLNIVVAGGGDSAADFAIDCSQYTNTISIIHRRDKLTCQEDKKEIILSKRNISVYTSYQIQSISKIDNSTIQISASPNLRLSCHKLVLCYGFINSSYIMPGLQTIGCDIQQSGISIDISNMQTSVRNCYAIGDIALYINKKKNVTNCFFEAARAIRDIKNKALHT